VHDRLNEKMLLNIRKGSHMHSIVIFFLVMSGTFAFLSTPAYSKGSSKSTVVRHAQKKTDLTTEQVFMKLYGNYNIKDETATWTMPKSLASSHDLSSMYYDAKVTVFLIYQKKYKEGGKEKAIFLTKLMPEGGFGMGSHAEGVVMGGAIFQKEKQGWELLIDERFVDEIGAWGDVEMPMFIMTELGKNRYGFMYFQSGHDSCTEQEAMVIYAEYEKKIRKIFEGVSGVKGNLCFDLKPYEYSSSISIVTKKGADFYPLELHFSGTDQIGNKIKRYRETKRYNFVNGKYKEK